MAKVREIVVRPPVGGVVRGYDFQSQPPYTAVNALNFWGRDNKTGRQRCALRPRLVSYGTGLSSTVRGLAQVNVATQQTLDRGLFAISGGTLYRYASGAWGSEGAAADSTRLISMAPYLQKLYIAGKAAGRPKVYDCVGDTLADIAISPGTASTIDNCTLVCVAFDRLFWSGNSSTPHGWWASRVATPLDYEFDLGATDVQQAINGTNLDGGNIGEKITAMLAHNRECLLFGATDSMHVMRGDPLLGGRLETLSHVVGPLGAASWCKTGDDQTVILTRNGLYVMAAGCGTAPQQLSKQRLPDALMGIDRDTYDAFLAYDSRFDGVHIYVTEKAGASTARQAWWMDWETGGFWPIELTTNEQPQSIMRFDPLDGSDVSGVLLGGNNVRRFDRTDASSIASGYLYIGPIKLSPTPFHKGIIQRMSVVFGSNHTDTTGTLALYCAESGEAAYNAAVNDTASRKYSIAAGDMANNLNCFPRVGGHAAVLKYTLGSGTAFPCIEQITLAVKDEGLYR